ncbi:MAG: peptidyl-prolyl cis-trans isomerase [Planctomycetes bacterium]|nr:peptidyl-prolyl cis-trans isomerase [Planctomycetota bacterium]
MLKRLQALWPGRQLRNRIFVAAAMLVVGTLAFFWGRHGGMGEVKADPPEPMLRDRQSGTGPNDYNKRVVAYIHNNIPITREELGEYLIARFGAQRVDFLINRRIVEMACQAKGITVTDHDVEAQLRIDLAGLGAAGGSIPPKEFENQILRPRGKTLYEWKEDVIRPKLAMGKLCEKLVVVTDEDLRKHFEARYGEKVDCRWIVLDPKDTRKDEIWAEVSRSEEKFREWSRKQPHSALASREGKAPPIHRNFAVDIIEKEAFSLKPGDVSRLIQMPPPDTSWVILKCDARVPPVPGHDLETERLALLKEVKELKLQAEIPKVFAELREKANPIVFLRDQVRQNELERDVRREISQAPGESPRNLSEAPRAVPPPYRQQ